MPSLRKTIVIPTEQDAWLRKKSISLSRYVQRKIKEEMEKEGVQNVAPIN
jgi:hypothetical protein